MRRAILQPMRLTLAPLGMIFLCVVAQAQPLDAVHEPEQPTVADEQQRREGTFTAGVLLLIGVTAVGLLLIAAAILWGAKVRRLVRRPQARSAKQDELWYLRKSPPPPDSGDSADEEPPPADNPDSVA